MLNPIVVSGSAAIALCVVGGLMTPPRDLLDLRLPLGLRGLGFGLSSALATRSCGFMRSSDSEDGSPNTGSLRPLFFFAIRKHHAPMPDPTVPGLKRR